VFQSSPKKTLLTHTGSNPVLTAKLKTMEKLKKYYPFWLGVLVLIALNGYEIFRQAPSIAMLIMYLVGYFKLTKLHDK
jgi:hypothetical protein